MIYLIDAYEDTRGGSHGMCNRFVFEGTLSEAIDAAREASYDVMDSYQCIWDDLMEAARGNLSENDEDEKEALYELFEEERENNVSYEIFKVIDDTISYAELKDKVYDQFEELTKKYCIFLPL